jgi:hypothetical protein
MPVGCLLPVLYLKIILALPLLSSNLVRFWFALDCICYGTLALWLSSCLPLCVLASAATLTVIFPRELALGWPPFALLTASRSKGNIL